MNKDFLNEFVAQIYRLVTVPAYTASLGFLASAGRGNPKYASLKAAADLYNKSTEDERKSLNDFTYSAIHYACFSFLHFLEDYAGQDESHQGKEIELVFTDIHSDGPPVDLFAFSDHQLRTLFRRYAATQEWKSFLTELREKMAQ